MGSALVGVVGSTNWSVVGINWSGGGLYLGGGH